MLITSRVGEDNWLLAKVDHDAPIGSPKAAELLAGDCHLKEEAALPKVLNGVTIIASLLGEAQLVERKRACRVRREDHGRRLRRRRAIVPRKIWCHDDSVSGRSTSVSRSRDVYADAAQLTRPGRAPARRHDVRGLCRVRPQPFASLTFGGARRTLFR